MLLYHYGYFKEKDKLDVVDMNAQGKKIPERLSKCCEHKRYSCPVFCSELHRYINIYILYIKVFTKLTRLNIFCFRKVMGEKVSNFPYYYHYTFLGFIAPAKM